MVNNKKLDMVKQPEMVKHLPGKSTRTQPTGGANGQGTIGAGVTISAETGAAQAVAVAAAGSDAGQCRGAGFLVALNILIEHID